MHLWMEKYFFYCSVRLGVIVSGVMSLVLFIVVIIIFLSTGIKVFDPLVDVMKNDDVYNKNIFVKNMLNWIENSPGNFTLFWYIYLLLYSGVCILAIYGAIRLLKWFLMPFIILEFIRVIACLIVHIVLMIVLKKLINLGVLIAVTLSGGFYILFLGYNWAASVALYQIITLVHSKRYRALYGDDPFAPLPTPPPTPSRTPPPSYSNSSQQHPYGIIDNVRVLVTPDANDIDEQKQINAAVNNKFKWKRSTPPMQQPIIAVIPVNPKYVDSIMPVIIGHNNTRLLQEQRQDYDNDNIGYNSDYENWQWNELVGAQRRHQQGGFLIGQN